MPSDTPLTIDPLTLQMVGVVEENETPRPEDAVALAVVVPPTASVADVKVIEPIV